MVFFYKMINNALLEEENFKVLAISVDTIGKQIEMSNLNIGKNF